MIPLTGAQSQAAVVCFWPSSRIFFWSQILTGCNFSTLWPHWKALDPIKKWDQFISLVVFKMFSACHLCLNNTLCMSQNRGSLRWKKASQTYWFSGLKLGNLNTPGIISKIVFFSQIDLIFIVLMHLDYFSIFPRLCFLVV